MRVRPVLILFACVATGVLIIREGLSPPIDANRREVIRAQDSAEPTTSVTSLPIQRDPVATPSLAKAFEETKIFATLRSLPSTLGLRELGPLSDEAMAATQDGIAASLATASRRLKEHGAIPNPDLNTQWAIHQKRFTCLKYACELACLQAGLYWTFEPGAAFSLNQQMNDAVEGKCWFIHLSTRSNGHRPVGVVVYVPHELFPEIEVQRREQQSFVKENNLQNR